MFFMIINFDNRFVNQGKKKKNKEKNKILNKFLLNKINFYDCSK